MRSNGDGPTPNEEKYKGEQRQKDKRMSDVSPGLYRSQMGNESIPTEEGRSKTNDNLSRKISRVSHSRKSLLNEKDFFFFLLYFIILLSTRTGNPDLSLQSDSLFRRVLRSL